jgi:hypothetical protein
MAQYIMMIMKIIYVHDRSKKRTPSKSKKLETIMVEHKRFLASVGYTGVKPRLHKVPNKPVTQKAEITPVKSLQEMVAPCLKRDIFERTRNESEKVKEAIRQKAARTAPSYNKGALQYITDGDNLKTLGKKI